MARHNEIGKIGEQVAQKWLKTKGFTIKDINYRKKYGEIDIVARGTTGKVHFVEVNFLQLSYYLLNLGLLILEL